MKLKVLVKFQDIKTGKVYNPDTVISITDTDRADNLVKRRLCIVYDADSAEKTVIFNENQFDLKTVKDALKSIDIPVAANAGVDAVTKKISELTNEQSKALAEILV